MSLMTNKIPGKKSETRYSRWVSIIAKPTWVFFVLGQLVIVNHFFGNVIFDKLIYRKSPWHGYNPKTGLCPSWVNKDGYRDIEFYEKKPGEYLILVVGDSIVYGQGLLTSQRFSNILEKKLDKIRSTRVFNLGECGTNIYRHYLVADRFKEELNPDLVVITFIGNDLLVLDEDKDFPRRLDKANKLVKDFRNNPDISIDRYMDQVLGAFDESTDNWRMLTYLLPKLPKDQTIYFFVAFEDHRAHTETILRIFSLFQENNFRAIHSLGLLGTNKTMSEFWVTNRERHPNPRANQNFSEILYKEITSDPQYHFLD